MGLGINESAVLQFLRDLSLHNDRADRIAVTQALSQCDDVGLNVIVLEPEPLPCRS